MALSRTVSLPHAVGESNVSPAPAQLDAARAALRAKMSAGYPRPLVKRVPGQDPLLTLAYADTFTLYDFMEVYQLARVHAILMMRFLVADHQIAPTTIPGQYYVIERPCRALVLHALAAPQFAARYIRAFVLDQFAPPDETPALVADVCPF
jgi:hypothetical protein